ncbi:MAG TPA: DinB family protein [Acidobacteriaceae bacterium]|nr:DinB family protein [Acidobacteriaceae bacterium]
MSTATVVSHSLSATDVLREQGKMIHRVLHLNVEGLTQADSLIQPQPAGNCLNWNVGHLVCVNEQLLALLGQPHVLGEAALQRYRRGSAPLSDPAEALPLLDLMKAWDEGWSRIDAGLAALTPERMMEPAPHSPRNNTEETVGSLASLILFHQAAHTGQTSLLRRIAGKPGAIR